ncbi:hypothetical protein K437DRAFT_255730 [Tilletiaria anomala UBC 951]|uniref:Uncharacterized protein n=1 Tax=Tilletiaria anomala (strain ATCC 24038 / CBS 436.72 / UBC 951) TaxID=1037660 RepID=A0A066WA91_TILAU|nr:uncharacterized protein K437DRAFT_255730 [Tilletiaria anomala UBC 951]KDN47999.1 hypothetical protein K437DRAFT_255730 [Tilletiaria anomala UBC 951]
MHGHLKQTRPAALVQQRREARIRHACPQALLHLFGNHLSDVRGRFAGRGGHERAASSAQLIGDNLERELYRVI